MDFLKYIRFVVLCVLFADHTGYAQSHVDLNGTQIRYTAAQSLTLIGKAGKGSNYFHRFDTAKFSQIPPSVKRLLTQSAGLAICFTTNSTSISAKWSTLFRKPSSNNTGIATSGLDLYIRKNGTWQYAGVGKPVVDRNNERVLVESMGGGVKECLLYLPLSDELKSLSIGIEEGAVIAPAPNPFRHNMLIYGSSIVHGSAASRPGMAYPAKLSRSTGLNFINFGFSGNAKMEKSVAEMISALPMDAFILDCVPNATAEQILERTADFVRTIRAKHPGKPIIVIESIIRETGNFNMDVFAKVKNQNSAFSGEIGKLQKTDMHLYFISSQGLLGDDHEGTIDGTHPTDLGFDRMVNKLKPMLIEILSKYNILATL